MCFCLCVCLLLIHTVFIKVSVEKNVSWACMMWILVILLWVGRQLLQGGCASHLSLIMGLVKVGFFCCVNSSLAFMNLVMCHGITVARSVRGQALEGSRAGPGSQVPSHSCQDQGSWGH